MSHDYQLAHTTPAPADFWTQGGSAVLAPPTPPSPGQSVSASPKLTPMTKAHRLLRGRYPLAITLAAAGAVAGAVVGYLAVAPRYVSTGMVQLDPRIVTLGVTDPNMNNYMMILQNQAGLLTSGNVAEAAMADKAFVDAYHLAYPGEPLPDDPTFVSNINVDHTRGASLLMFSYSDRSKPVAEAAATSALKAYQTLYGSDEAVRYTDTKIAYNRQRLDKVEADLAAKRQEMDGVVKQYGDADAVTSRQNFVDTHALNGENELKAFQQQYNEAQNLSARGGGRGQSDNEMVYQEIKATNDRDMGLYLDARYFAQQRLEEAVAQGHLPSSLIYQQQSRSLDQAKQRVDDYAHTFVAVHPGVIATPLAGNGNGLTSLVVMKNRLDQMQATVEAEKAEETQLASVKQRMLNIKTDTDNLVAQQTALISTIQQLHDTQQLTKTVQISMPGEATLQNDRRKAIGGVGFVLGGLFPLGLMMLYGMRDSRFRYSDETTEADLAGVALLGILPNLPDRLSDPQQAGIAAHCVHQIRTMLQISRSNDEPQVLAITSASTGDGKTSLTLALGLSYAACGARTLLIDCDLLAAGLTHRLNVSSPDGVLEAVANRALLEYVRTTDIADVAILPVGTTHAHHASTLSPRRPAATAERGQEAVRHHHRRHRPDPGQHRGQPDLRRRRPHHPGRRPQPAAAAGRTVDRPPPGDRRQPGRRRVQPRPGQGFRKEHERPGPPQPPHPRQPRRRRQQPQRRLGRQGRRRVLQAGRISGESSKTETSNFETEARTPTLCFEIRGFEIRNCFVFRR